MKIRLFNTTVLVLVILTMLLSAFGSGKTWLTAHGDRKSGESVEWKVEKKKGDPLAISVRSYRRGIDLIRLLYEKALSLEYHFASLQLDHRIEQLSNPMNFAAFRESVKKLEGLNKTR